MAAERRRADRKPSPGARTPSRGTAGYSGTPLPRKLGLKPGGKLMLLDAPDDFDGTLGALPDGVTVTRAARGQADVIVLFAPRAGRLAARLPAALGAVAAGGCLWVAWPKQAAGVATDLSRDVVRAAVLSETFVDTKVCALDATWSGLQFRRRR